MPKNKQKHKNRNAFQKRKSSASSALNTFRFSRPVIIIAAVSLLTLLAAANIQTTRNLTANAQASVLGDNEDKDEGKQKEEKKEESKSGSSKEERIQEEQRDNRGSSGSQKSGSSNVFKTQSVSPKPTSSNSLVPSSIEVSPTDIDEVDNEDEDENEQETELVTADGQKIKTKVKNGVTTKIEIERGELKLKYKLENGRLVLKVENETGEELDIDENELQELEDETENELQQQGVAIAPVEGNTVAVTKNQVAAVTDFPLSIDVGTNQLILTTPEGPRVVTILPDQAVQNLLATGIINRVETQPTDSTTQTQLGAFTGVVKLEIRNNDIVYKVNGVKTHRMLGFIPVNTDTTAFVSANSGTVVAQQRSVLANVVDFLSP